MNREMMDGFKRQLKTLLANETLKALEEDCRQGITIVKDGDEADQVAMERQRTMSFRLKNRNETYQKKIWRALEKIEDGIYGECEDCGCNISYGRLKARPTADLCIDCKEEQEKGEDLIFDAKKFQSSRFEVNNVIKMPTRNKNSGDVLKEISGS